MKKEYQEEMTNLIAKLAKASGNEVTIIKNKMRALDAAYSKSLINTETFVGDFTLEPMVAGNHNSDYRSFRREML